MNTANRDVWAQRDLLQNEIWTVPTRHCLTLPSRTTYFPPPYVSSISGLWAIANERAFASRPTSWQPAGTEDIWLSPNERTYVCSVNR